MCAQWKKDFNPNFFLDKLQKSSKVNQSGDVSFETVFFEEYLTFFSASLDISKNIPELIRREMIAETILDFFKGNEISSQRFLSIINRAESQYLKMPTMRYVLVTEASLKYFDGLSVINLNNCSVMFDNVLSKKFGRKKIMKEVYDFIRERYPTGYTGIRVNVKVKSELEAGGIALDVIELLFGIWNLYLNNRIISRDTFGYIKPFNRIMLGPVHTLHFPNGKLASKIFWYDPNYVEPIETIDLKRDWVKLKNFERRVRKLLRKSPYQDDLTEALKRYSRALDERDFNNVLLKLWSLLEFLTSSSDSYKTTVERTIFLFSESDFHRQILNQLKEFRNQYVHLDKGSGYVEIYVNQLRMYVEKLLLYHLNNVFNFKSLLKACEFLDNSREVKILTEKIRILNRALKFRNK